MKYFLIFTFALSSLASLVAMDPNEEKNKLHGNPNLVANLLEGLKKKEQEDHVQQQQRDANAQRAADALLGHDTPWQLGKNAHLCEQQSEAKKSANPLEIASGIASSKYWKVGVAVDPEEAKKEYEQDIEALKHSLEIWKSTKHIQQHLKKLDKSQMKYIWVEHFPLILACAQSKVVRLEEALKKALKDAGDHSGVEENYQLVYANKVAIKRFDALKMREWFS